MYIYANDGSNLTRDYSTNFILKPKESKCIYDYPTTTTYKFNADLQEKVTGGSYVLGAKRNSVDEGNFKIEKCKSKTYTIK